MDASPGEPGGIALPNYCPYYYASAPGRRTRRLTFPV